MIKIFSILISLLAIPSITFGTQQVPDEMIKEGKLHYVYGFILSDKMYKSLKTYKKNDKKIGVTTANFDGFYVKLKLSNGKLYLTDVGIGHPLLPSGYKSQKQVNIFNINIPKDGLFAEWFSGYLEEYYGEIVMDSRKYVRIFNFQNGKLISINDKLSDTYKYLQKTLKKCETDKEKP